MKLTTLINEQLSVDTLNSSTALDIVAVLTKVLQDQLQTIEVLNLRLATFLFSIGPHK